MAETRQEQVARWDRAYDRLVSDLVGLPVDKARDMAARDDLELRIVAPQDWHTQEFIWGRMTVVAEADVVTRAERG